jgi:DNA-binding MarR family transcriptional regulator
MRLGDGYDAGGVQLLFAVRALARRVNERVNDWLRPFEINARELNFLASLDAYGARDVTPNELAALTHSSNAGVTQTLDSLERRGLLERRPHPVDGRSTIVKLTAAGKARFDAAFAVHNARIKEIAATLPPEEQRAVLDGLARLGEMLQK